MNKKLLFLLFISISLIISCAKDQGELSQCSTIISFATDIKPVIVAKCTSCHSPTGSVPGYGDFNDYNAVKTEVDKGNFATKVIVEKSMPQGSSLTSTEFRNMKCWLEQGAKNN